jgi:CubicO group peptidase (beta-lactamase class C family)
MRPDAIFDLASLTKVIATTTAVMQLVEAGRLRLDEPVAAHWPEFGSADKGAITVRQLLTHTSGLRPDLDPATRWSGEAAALARVLADHPIHPPGSRFLYSDINFIVLGELVHRVSGEPLDVYARRHIFAPLHMADTAFHPAFAERVRIAPTDREDGMLRWGEVQDPTAYRMGGVAGHAGLFSTADDLARFARMLLSGGEGILRRETIAAMTAAIELPGGVRRGLGWDAASPYAAGMDAEFGPRAYGHTGYTGTMLWIDPASQTFLIVLTSRLHPAGRGDVKPLREAVAKVVAVATRRRFDSMSSLVSTSE